jgi:hypothetical protein
MYSFKEGLFMAIGSKRVDTGGGIVGAGGVEKERAKASGGVVVAIVCRKRGGAHSGVIVAGSVAEQRPSAVRRVAATRGVVLKGS